MAKEFVDGPRSVRVLSEISLSVERGETVSIVGESGVGKSTLLHILGGLERPSSGAVRVGEVDLSEQSEKELARFRNESIGFVFQFHHLMPDFTALENVMMPSLIAGEHPREARGPAEAILERVGLADRLDHRPGELSGGEQQRVAVARAVVRHPDLVLADEPTGNLDPDTASDIERLLVELNGEVGTTCVVVTHSDRLAGAMDRRLRLTHGHIETA
ncbi:MAG: ABC transporter ATP-binding protein [Candidatus Binatia bacterium]|nr:ABC transporter ATP-binding protein [Candidatus Binatia bacterium]